VAERKSLFPEFLAHAGGPIALLSGGPPLQVARMDAKAIS